MKSEFSESYRVLGCGLLIVGVLAGLLLLLMC
nr:MAG TPA: Preprotein translocase subunit SecE, Preprotein, archaeal, ribosomal, 50S, protein.0A [Caudoviricetes sp.]